MHSLRPPLPPRRRAADCGGAPMSLIHRADAEALATFVRRLRPDWNQAGTVAAIQASRTAALSEVAVALIRLAEDGSAKTPALLNTDGHWWFRAARNEQ